MKSDRPILLVLLTILLDLQHGSDTTKGVMLQSAVTQVLFSFSSPFSLSLISYMYH